MTKRSHRVFYTLSALFLGIGIIVLISFAGGKFRGPLENLFVKAGATVQQVEQNLILENRQHKRIDKLKWFKSFRSDTALLKNPPVILFGAYDNQARESFESIISLEDSLHTTLPLIHIYKAWGSKPEEQFPKEEVEAIYEIGSLPVITWEPWLTDFDEETYPQLRKPEYRDKGGMTDVSKGVYDVYITQWAQDAKSIGNPIFVRLGHEMNDPYRYPWGPHNNTAKSFIAAWRHVHNVFVANGATNVIWIWSPHPAYGYFDAFYPGDKFVDYVGVGTLNYGNVANWSKWWTFKEIFGKHYDELAVFKKPIMLTELGCLAAGGDRSKWFEEAFDQFTLNYPSVKAILYFHFSDDKTTTQQTLNWYFKDDHATTQAIMNGIKNWPSWIKPKITHSK
jgi:hypothetical protein